MLKKKEKKNMKIPIIVYHAQDLKILSKKIQTSCLLIFEDLAFRLECKCKKKSWTEKKLI